MSQKGWAGVCQEEGAVEIKAWMKIGYLSGFEVWKGCMHISLLSLILT